MTKIVFDKDEAVTLKSELEQLKADIDSCLADIAGSKESLNQWDSKYKVIRTRTYTVEEVVDGVTQTVEKKSQYATWPYSAYIVAYNNAVSAMSEKANSMKSSSAKVVKVSNALGTVSGLVDEFENSDGMTMSSALGDVGEKDFSFLNGYGTGYGSLRGPNGYSAVESGRINLTEFLSLGVGSFEVPLDDGVIPDGLSDYDGDGKISMTDVVKTYLSDYENEEGIVDFNGVELGSLADLDIDTIMSYEIDKEVFLNDITKKLEETCNIEVDFNNVYVEDDLPEFKPFEEETFVTEMANGVFGALSGVLIGKATEGMTDEEREEYINNFESLPPEEQANVLTELHNQYGALFEDDSQTLEPEAGELGDVVVDDVEGMGEENVEGLPEDLVEGTEEGTEVFQPGISGIIAGATAAGDVFGVEGEVVPDDVVEEATEPLEPVLGGAIAGAAGAITAVPQQPAAGPKPHPGSGSSGSGSSGPAPKPEVQTEPQTGAQPQTTPQTEAPVVEEKAEVVDKVEDVLVATQNKQPEVNTAPPKGDNGGHGKKPTPIIKEDDLPVDKEPEITLENIEEEATSSSAGSALLGAAGLGATTIIGNNSASAPVIPNVDLTVSTPTVSAPTVSTPNVSAPGTPTPMNPSNTTPSNVPNSSVSFAETAQTQESIVNESALNNNTNNNNTHSSNSSSASNGSGEQQLSKGKSSGGSGSSSSSSSNNNSNKKEDNSDNKVREEFDTSKPEGVLGEASYAELIAKEEKQLKHATAVSASVSIVSLAMSFAKIIDVIILGLILLLVALLYSVFRTKKKKNILKLKELIKIEKIKKENSDEDSEEVEETKTEESENSENKENETSEEKTEKEESKKEEVKEEKPKVEKVEKVEEKKVTDTKKEESKKVEPKKEEPKKEESKKVEVKKEEKNSGIEKIETKATAKEIKSTVSKVKEVQDISSMKDEKNKQSDK